MSTENITELKRRLEQAEGLLEALRGNEMDAVVRNDGVALLRLRKEEDRLRRTAQLREAVNRISKGMHSSLESERIMQLVVDEGARTLDCETAALSLRESGAWNVLHVHGLPTDLVGTVINDEEDPHALLALETGRPVAVGNALEDTRCNREHMRRHGIRSVLVIPLIVGERPLGVLFFNYHSAPHDFSREEIHFAVQIGATASAAIENARLFAEAGNTAEALRHSQRQLYRTMTAAGVFTCEWDPESDILLRSENCAAILGMDPAAATRDTGENLLRHIHEDDKAHVAELLRGMKPDAPEYECHYRFMRGDGGVVWIEESGRAEFDKAGRMLRLRCVARDITERMQALVREKEAAAVKAAAQSALDIVESMGEGVLLCRLDGIVTTVNPAFERLGALGRGEMIGRNLRDLLPRFLEETDLPEMMRVLDEAMGSRLRPDIRPVRLKRESRVPVIVSPSLAFIPSSSGTPVSMVLTFQDVSGLYQQGELLNQIFDNTHMQMVYLDKDFHYVRVNRAYADYHKREAGFFSGKNYLEQDPHPRDKQIFGEVRRTGTPFSECGTPFRSPDPSEGDRTYWDWSLRPIVNDPLGLQGFLLCMLDVTKRVKAQRELAESEKKYRELVQNAHSIIMRVTPDQRITFFNEYAQRFFGYAAAEVLGRKVVGTIVPETDSQGRNLRTMTEAISAQPESHASNENENLCKDGRRVWVHWSNRAERDEEGRLTGLLCVGTDITARKQIETRAHRYQQRLKRLAEKLASTEEEERWRISRYLHDTVVQNLSLSNVRMGGLVAPLQAAEMEKEAEKLRQIRTLIEKAIEECRMVMSDLTPALLYELGLNAALKDLAGKLEKSHQASVRIEDSGGEISMSNSRRGLLFESARELIMNALKHAGPCQVRVSIDESDGLLTLRVQDNGKGFDPAAVSHEEENGSHGGFGMFSIRERLEGLGGSLEIMSAPGKGTTAIIHLPLDSQ